MQNHYEILKVKPNANNWKILKAFEQLIRDNKTLNRKDIVYAYLVLTHKDARRYFDYLNSGKVSPNSVTGIRFTKILNSLEKKSKKLIKNENFNSTIKENTFWEFGWPEIFFRMTRIKERGWYIHLFFHYGIIILLSFNSLYLITLIPFTILISYIKEYRKLKIEYYRQKLLSHASIVDN